jgi:uncharacterized protein involved in exopolysaccharide biosynthesis
VANVDTLLNGLQSEIEQVANEIDRVAEELLQGTGVELPTTIAEDHTLSTAINAQIDSILDTGSSAIGAGSAADIDARPLSQMIVQLATRRQQFQAELEGLTAESRELLRSRDTAWELYTTLDNKSREAEAQFATGAPQVRFALPAIPPTTRNPRGVLTSTLIGAVVGAVLALLFVWAREYWEGTALSLANRKPLHRPQPSGD